MESRKNIKVGTLGEKVFQPGIYVYVGSAMNNVEKRIKRHFSDKKNLHWHVDYFSSGAEPLDYFILPESSDYECVLAEIMKEIGEPMENLGASDCNCNAHLFRIENTSLTCEAKND